MNIMLFVSRRKPTDKQRVLAGQCGYAIVHAGYANAFGSENGLNCIFKKYPRWDAICVAHPALAIQALSRGKVVAIFEMTQPHSGVPINLHLYTMLDGHVLSKSMDDFCFDVVK